MKRLNYLMNGLAALALIVLFAQCAGNTDKQTTNAPAQAGGLSEMKIAYVEIDTLLAKYNYCIDLNEAMVKKGENVRLTLNQKASELEKQKQGIPDKVPEQRLSFSGESAAGIQPHCQIGAGFAKFEQQAAV